MVIYWLMFLVSAWAVLQEKNVQIYPIRSRLGVFWVTASITLTILIGLRYQVGGDWGTYQNIFDEIADESLQYAVLKSDPTYGALNWLSAQLGWGIVGVNIACGGLFSWGLVSFCKQQPRAKLALLVAIPYLVIVIAMGYSRQAVAIGLVMLALARLARGDNFRFVLWVALAATFHKSAVIMVPLAILAGSRNRAWSILWIGVTCILLYVLFIAEKIDTLYFNYVSAEMQSQGGAIRVLMNAVPAVIFLYFRRRFRLPEAERALWTWVSLMALGFMVFLGVSPSSTAVDRLALYMIPLQLFVFARLPDVLGSWGKHNLLPTAVIIFYYACIQFVWLNFAQNAYAWVPYRFYIFE